MKIQNSLAKCVDAAGIMASDTTLQKKMYLDILKKTKMIMT